MKLILCANCGGLVPLSRATRSCGCGDSWGWYVNDVLAEYGGEAIPVGIDNRDLLDAINRYPDERFTIRCWVMPPTCATMQPTQPRTRQEPLDAE